MDIKLGRKQQVQKVMKFLNRANRMLAPNPLVNGPIVNKLDPSAFLSSGSGSALLVNQKRSSRTIRMEINSIDRDYSKNPYSSNFVWTLPYPIKELREVRLIGGTVPVPYLNIDSNWNQFTFQEDTIQYTITIPVGYYTIITLMSKLSDLLNTAVGVPGRYTVSQNITGQLVITSDRDNIPFSLLFSSGVFVDTFETLPNSFLNIGCPARLLGFGNLDYSSSAGVITSTNLPNLWYCLERSYLYFNFDSTQDLRNVLRGSGRKEPSAIIYNDELNSFNLSQVNTNLAPIPLVKYLNKETFDTSIVSSPASLSRIRTFEISLRDMFYNLINTQGREMSLLLEMVVVD